MVVATPIKRHANRVAEEDASAGTDKYRMATGFVARDDDNTTQTDASDDGIFDNSYQETSKPTIVSPSKLFSSKPAGTFVVRKKPSVGGELRPINDGNSKTGNGQARGDFQQTDLELGVFARLYGFSIGINAEGRPELIFPDTIKNPSEELQAQITLLEASIHQKDEALVSVRAELSKIKEENYKLQESVKSLTESVEAFSKQAESDKVAIETLSKQKKGLEETISQINNEVEELRSSPTDSSTDTSNTNNPAVEEKASEPISTVSSFIRSTLRPVRRALSPKEVPAVVESEVTPQTDSPITLPAPEEIVTPEIKEEQVITEVLPQHIDSETEDAVDPDNDSELDEIQFEEIKGDVDKYMTRLYEKRDDVRKQISVLESKIKQGQGTIQDELKQAVLSHQIYEITKKLEHYKPLVEGRSKGDKEKAQVEVKVENTIEDVPAMEPVREEPVEATKIVSPEENSVRESKKIKSVSSIISILARNRPHAWTSFVVPLASQAPSKQIPTPQAKSTTLEQVASWRDFVDEKDSDFLKYLLGPSSLSFTNLVEKFAPSVLTEEDKRNPSKIAALSQINCHELLTAPGTIHGLHDDQRADLSKFVSTLEGFRQAIESHKKMVHDFNKGPYAYPNKGITLYEFYEEIRSQIEQADNKESKLQKSSHKNIVR